MSEEICMTPDEIELRSIRLKAIELASGTTTDPVLIIETAQKMVNFVLANRVRTE